MGLIDNFLKASKQENNFRYLQDMINSGKKEIILNSNITLSDSEESDFPQGIEISSDDVVIDGNKNTIDARQINRIFKVTGKNVILTNIKFKGGLSQDQGASILNHGTLKIADCEFSDCWSLGSGGVFFNAGKVEISNSIFVQNTATKFGGVFHNFSGEIYAVDCLFENNKSKHGAVITNEKGKVLIKNSRINSNTSSLFTGVIDNYDVMEIIACDLTNNTSTNGNGGAITNAGKISIADTLFRNNDSPKGSSLYNKAFLSINTSKIEYDAVSDGGAIYNEIGELKMSACEICGNSVQSEEGLMTIEKGDVTIVESKFLKNYVSNNLITNNDSLKIFNCSFKNNKSKNTIFNALPDSSYLTVVDDEFAENNVEDSIILNNGNACEISNSLFEDNLLEKSINIHNKSNMVFRRVNIRDDGKTVCNEGNLTLRDEKYDILEKIRGVNPNPPVPPIVFGFSHLDNLIQQRETDEIILDVDITLINDELEYYEGGIDLDEDNLIIDGNNHIIDANCLSRIFFITAKNLTLKNIIFKNGSSHKVYGGSFTNNGGTLYVNSNARVEIINCRFLNNSSLENGGVIYNKGETFIRESSLNDNTSKLKGGAIYNDGNMIIKNCEIKNNVAYDGGGAICDMAELQVEDSSFVGNSSKIENGSQSFGGAILCQGRERISKTRFIENSCVIGGGAILNYGGEIEIGDCDFVKNSVDMDEFGVGGALFNQGIMNVSTSKFAENQANKGAALANFDMGQSNITESMFEENEADYGGGTLFAVGGIVNVDGCLIKANRSYYRGGGIYCDGSDGYSMSVKVRNSNFESNSAISSGGAVFVENSDIDIDNCNFKDNKPDDIRK